MLYSIYRTELMLNFLNEYTLTNTPVIGRPILASLYNAWVFVLPIVVLVFSSILLVIMSYKQKPRTYYFLMILAHIIFLGLFIYGFVLFGRMQETIVDLRTVKAFRDLLLYGIVLQGILAIASLIRGVGFDIKKFDFGQDLQDLEISQKDNEEFELAINFDLNDKARTGRRILRKTKYFCKEHKFFLRMVTGICVIGLLYYAYYSYSIYHKVSKEGTNFDMNGFTLGATRSYLVTEDYRGHTLNEDGTYLLVVDLNVKYNYTVPKALATGAIELKVSGDTYHHTNKYSGLLDDLGIVYNNQTVGNEFTHYLLVYEISEKTINSEMRLGFRNMDNGETAYVKLEPTKLYEEKETLTEAKLGEELNFKNSHLGNTTLKITDYEMRDRFTIRYLFCTKTTNNCMDSIEYLMPNLYNSNYDKTLLKLNAEIHFDKNFVSANVKDIYSFFSILGKIEYEIDGQKKTQDVYLGEVKNAKIPEGTYYLEVFREIKIADKIDLVFQVRNHTYRYSLK